ncbi:MAG: hypothetical protein KA765_18925 [Thermoflexales bacterium]|nr:hypothetical protein [Thermoflexales bacterium]
MGPIEYLWFILTLLFAVIGIVRGFLKELGVTIVLIATLFGLDRIIPLLEQFIRDGKLSFIFKQGNPTTDQPTNLALMVIFQVLILIAVFVSYQGETLAYEGNNPKFPVGIALGALVGGVNGYLITGSLWWLLAHYNYPVDAAMLNKDLLTTFAKDVVGNGLLPFDLLGAGTASVESLGLLPIILVVLIILKVVR